MNVNFRYAFNRKWRVGAEYILTIASEEEVNDPFHTFGLTADYDLLRTKKSKLNLRGGICFGNLSYADDFEPKRRTVINRVLGITYDFRISPSVWWYVGYYSHWPINKIPYKYAMVQPFILGAYVDLQADKHKIANP